MTMCDASFIPLELIDKLLEFSPELTQEDYIKLREQIETRNGLTEIAEEINKILDNKESTEKPGGSITEKPDEPPTEKEKFEVGIVKYAHAQMKYASDGVIDKLKATANEFLDPSTLRGPLTTKDHLLTLERHLAGYYATWILDIGLKSGLFKAISEARQAISAEELSWTLGLTPLYVAVWCRAAYSFEFLDAPSGLQGYRLASGIKELLLDPTHPASMRFDIAFSTMLHQDFLKFPIHLRTGARWPLADRPAELHKLYIEATQDDYPVITDVILPWVIKEERTKINAIQTEEEKTKQLYAIQIVEEKITQPKAVLDVGTGAGFALIHYADRFQSAKITGIDISPSAVEEAQRMIQVAVATKNEFLDNNIEVRCQDVKALTDTETYDLIIVNLVLYQIGITDYLTVFQRIYDALKPDGLVVISEYNFPALEKVRTFRFPGFQSFLSHLLHFTLIGATMLPSQQLVEYMKKASFKGIDGTDNIKAIHHPLEERQVIVARKQGNTTGA